MFIAFIVVSISINKYIIILGMYRIPIWPDIRLKRKYRILFSTKPNNPYFAHIEKVLKNLLILSSHHLFNSLSGYPAEYPVIRPDIQQMKPDIRPDSGYKKGRISGTALYLY